MHFGTILLLCLCFSEQFGIRRLCVYAASDKDVLARLLDLHAQYCGDDVMCHDANATHVEPPSAFPRPCCIPCSCLSTCGAEQNCCPSVNNPVPQAIQSSNAEKPKKNNSQNDEHDWSPTSMNKTEAREASLRSAIGGAFTTYGMEHEQDTVVTPKKMVGTTRAESSDSKPNSHDNIKTECVRPQLFYKPNLQPDSDTYEMIVSCPPGLVILRSLKNAGTDRRMTTSRTLFRLPPSVD